MLESKLLYASGLCSMLKGSRNPELAGLVDMQLSLARVIGARFVNHWPSDQWFLHVFTLQ